MKKFKENIRIVKRLLKQIKEFYNSLSPFGKIIFILVLIICKLGPDMILFPMLIKWINRRRESKLDANYKAFNDEIDEIIEEVD